MTINLIPRPDGPGIGLFFVISARVFLQPLKGADLYAP